MVVYLWRLEVDGLGWRAGGAYAGTPQRLKSAEDFAEPFCRVHEGSDVHMSLLPVRDVTFGCAVRENKSGRDGFLRWP